MRVTENTGNRAGTAWLQNCRRRDFIKISREKDTR